MKRVFLIDSMSHIYRAYFAPMGTRQDPLRNSKGQVTQAVFVFTNMLRKLLKDERPDYIAAVFESETGTFRHDSYAEYKANRLEMPDDLQTQIPYILRVCEAFNIPILQADKYEADDVIGTLAKKVADKGMQAVIVSNDKDLCQLVTDPHVIGMRQNSTNVKRKVPVPPIEWCDEAWVVKKFGVPPNKIVDLLGLMGDSVDNIPGAPGIGEKGALKLVLEFGSTEAAMENAEKVTHKTYRESLQNNQDIIRQSLELATIHTDAPVELNLDQLKASEPDRAKAYSLFRELEFAALTKEFGDSAPSLFDSLPDEVDSERPAPVEQAYSIVQTRADLDKLIRKVWEREWFAFELDDSNEGKWHSSFDKQAPLGVAISHTPGIAAFVDLENFDDRKWAIRVLKDLFENPYIDKSTHDYKCKAAVLAKIGITAVGVKNDLMIASYLLDTSRPHHELEVLAQHNLNVFPDSPAEGFTESGWKATVRADWAYQLTPIMSEKIKKDELEKVYSEIEIPIGPILADIERAGMKVDDKELGEFSEFIAKELAIVSEKIFKIAGREFNIGSPKQVGEIFEELNIATGKKTATGQIS
ncbi:MAG: 5'-3' exonuclease H3TH domain-containing protein, partial [bacterium]|nr:5'-3' exonuclease H3TH domain-containing protein [bacterium]